MTAIVFTLACALRWLVCAVMTTAFVLAVLPWAFFARTHAWRSIRYLSRLQLRLLGVRVETEYRDDGRHDAGPYVFVGLNQISLIDGIALLAVIPVPTRVIYNLAWAFFPFGWPSVILGGAVVVRGWAAQRRRALARAKAQLRAGYSFAMSVEGARFGVRDSHGLLPYRTGAARLALSAGVPVVPIVGRGSAELLPPGSWRVRPGTMRMIFCAPIPTKGLSEDDRDTLTASLRAIAVQEIEAGHSHGA